MNIPLLSLLIWLPILGGGWVLYIGDRYKKTINISSLATAIAIFLLSILLYYRFDNSTHAMQFIEYAAWIPQFGINYHLGVDGISLPLIVLNSFICMLIIISVWGKTMPRLSHYMAAFLILTGFMNGVFMAMDTILFYVFWEAILIPMLLIIGVWGGPKRVYAAIKFFLYTFFGSVFMLLALLYLYAQAGSFEIFDLYDLPLALEAQKIIFIAFFLAFAVKIPMWPVHTWLPDAHVEAPTQGSIILAAIMLKMGGYGFLRFSLPITPDASLYFSDAIIFLSLIAIVYIGFIALVQKDIKKLIAYSSISHMGFATLGIFICFNVFTATGTVNSAAMALEGGMMQMISHGFISAALFFCIGVLYDRVHSREISAYGGVANTMPRFAALMMLFAMANAGLPGTSGFVGEFLVILSSFQASFWVAFCAAFTLILGAAYTLWMYKRAIFGAVANTQIAQLKDLQPRELLILSALAAAVLLFGIWPAPIIDPMHKSIEGLLVHVLQGKL